MTESEAKCIIIEYKPVIGFARYREALDRAMIALEEVQQYREFKAIFESHFSEDALKLLSDKEEFARWLERGKHVAKRGGELRVELDRFEAIGTVSEFRQLKEKATAKKAIGSREKHEAYCPNCKAVIADDEFWLLDEYIHHCECGQAILGSDWSEGWQIDGHYTSTNWKPSKSGL